MKSPLQTIRAGTLALLIAAAAAAHADVTMSTVWSRRFNSPANTNDYPSSLAIDPSGNVLITGRTWNGDGTSDAYTAKYAGVDGSIVWERRHDRVANAFGGNEKQLVVDPGGNALVVGYSTNEGTGGFRISKFAAADGATLWERFLGEGNPIGYAFAPAVDADGNLVVAYRPGAEESYLIGKFAAADGAPLWQRPFGESPGDYPSAPALDASGNVIVSGGRVNDPSTVGFYTAKYAAATGALIWENRFKPPIDIFFGGLGATVDQRGDVVAVGYYAPPNGYNRLLIAKYASADGSVLWHTGIPKDPTAELTTAYTPADVAVDNAGNVFVASSMIIEDPLGLRHMFPVHTAKFAAADGALLWERKHTRQHAEELIDNAGGIALDSFGNVVMWGWLFAAVYSPADGTILWESPPFDWDSTPIVYSGSHLATGPQGMIATLGQVNNNADFETSVFRSVPSPSSFAGWVAGFGLAGAAPASDPDADGLPSAVEYVLGGDPSAATLSDHLAGHGAGQTWTLRFQRQDISESPDCALAVEVGSTLGSWPERYVIGHDTQSSSLGVSIEENGPAPDTIILTVPLAASAPRFARLAVTITP